MKLKLLTCLIIIAIGSSACSPTAPGQGATPPAAAPQAWFDSPLPGTLLFPPSPVCPLVAHAASPKGIAQFELSINGVAASLPSPDTASSLVTLSQECGLAEPGHYILRLRAQDNAGAWSEYAETDLTISPPEQAPNTPTPTLVPQAPMTETVTPTIVPVAGVTIERVSANMIYIGRPSCGPLEVSIAARANAPAGIQVVVLFYRFAYDGAPAGFESTAMNPMGGDLYQGTINPTAALGGVPFEQATLQYQVVVQQQNGDLTIRTPVLADVAVQACGPVDRVVTSCSAYTDERTCIANGCSWANIPGTRNFECRQP